MTYLLGDGCIFIWRLPQSMTSNMLAKLNLKSSNAYNNNNMTDTAQQNQYANSPQLLGPEAIPPPEVEMLSTQNNILDPNANQLDPSQSVPDYKFSVGQLPVWAKKQMASTNTNGTAKELSDQSQLPKSSAPKGRWGQRLVTGNTTGPSATINERDMKADQGEGGSKESSLEGHQTIGNKLVRQLLYWF